MGRQIGCKPDSCRLVRRRMASSLSRSRLYLIGRLAAIPRDHPLKRIARSLGVGRWLGLSDKYYFELSWQNR
jgi:hypothetical protein